jgi:HPt (histidine-containing phosphotransfer) domain-containing protein
LRDQRARDEGPIVVHVDPDLEELVPQFLENRQKDIIMLRHAVGKGDYKAIQALGHTLKGTGGGYGFDQITEIGRCLEEAAVANDAARIGELADELESYLRRVDIVYQ